MIPADETFDGTFPFEPHFSEAPGFRMHYVDEGEGEPLVLLHGEPTWGYLYRKFIPPLSETHRVIVPDHIGFGKSETPQDRVYTMKTHVENLTALIDELELHDITFVVQDWGGMISSRVLPSAPGSGQAILRDEHQHRRGRPARLRTGRRRDGSNGSASTMKRARSNEALGHLDTNVLSVMKIIGLENMKVVNDTWIRAYSAPFPDQASCIGAINFPLDIYLRRTRDYVMETAHLVPELSSKPAMMVEGMKDQAGVPEFAIGVFREMYPRCADHDAAQCRTLLPGRRAGDHRSPHPAVPSN